MTCNMQLLSIVILLYVLLICGLMIISVGRSYLSRIMKIGIDSKSPIDKSFQRLKSFDDAKLDA